MKNLTDNQLAYKKLKFKFLLALPMFALALIFICVGVYALQTTTVELSGTISFQASNIQATITGSFSGMSGTAPTLSTLTYTSSSEPTTAELNTWKNLDLDFDSSATNIVATITITNTSTERALKCTVTQTNSAVTNLGQAMSGATSGTEFTIAAGGTNSKTITLTFSVTDKNLSLNDVAFSYSIALQDPNAST